MALRTTSPVRTGLKLISFSAVDGDEIVGARVGKIETFPWEEKPMPEILKPAEQLLGELMPESNYTGFGMKKDDKIYRSMLLATKSTTRGQGVAGRVSTLFFRNFGLLKIEDSSRN